MFGRLYREAYLQRAVGGVPARGERLGILVDIGLVDPLALLRLVAGLQKLGVGIGDEGIGGGLRAFLGQRRESDERDGKRRQQRKGFHGDEPLGLA